MWHQNNIRVFALLLAIGVIPICGSSAQSQSQDQEITHTQDGYQLSEQHKQGTENAPLVVKVQATTNDKSETRKETDDREERISSETTAILLNATIAYWTIIIGSAAVIQCVIYAFQAWFLYLTLTHARGSNEIAQRAYLNVNVGQASFQDRTREPPIKFEARPELINNGSTPARNIEFRSHASVLPNPLPEGYVFEVSGIASPAVSFGSGQGGIMAKALPDLLPDEVAEIVKSGGDNALYSWGTIKYKDVFGNDQETQFCIMYRWVENNAIWGVFVGPHNRAT